MNIALNLETVPDRDALTRCDNSLRCDWRSVIQYVCHVIADYNCGDFVIDCFGDHDWPVDERTDLAVFLEQLPAAIDSIHDPTTNSFKIDFFEQGVERTLIFERQTNYFCVKCTSMLLWQPTIEKEIVLAQELEHMLVTIQDTFIDFALQLPLDRESTAVLLEWKVKN